MCGIFFYKGKEVNSIADKLIAASNTIKPRGPEKTSIIYSNNYFIAFHRLSINNISNECNQPFIYHENNFTYYVMCNGEIYNWKSLLSIYNLNYTLIKNDCSVIFPLFKHLKYNIKSLCNVLQGEFSFAIIQIDNDNDMVSQVWSGTDVCSVRPLFYHYDDNTYILSSLLSGISSLHDVVNTSKTYRLDGSMYMHYQLLYSNFSYILEKCFYTEILNNNPHYFNDLDNYKSIEKDYYLNIVDTLRRCVERRIDTNNTSRELGCLLSGGLDSSLVAALASEYLKRQNKQLITFSIGMKGGTDLEYAKKVANYIGSRHFEILFTPEEGLQAIDEVIKCCETYDITTIRASVGQHLIAKWISSHTNIKVLLNGDGADECEMGYMYFYKAPNSLEAAMDSQRLVKEIHYFDGLRVDRNISNYGLEARVPFLDKEFVELFQKIPPKFKVPSYKNCEKYLIRKAFECVYSEQPILPQEVLWRRKEAFSDGVSSKEKSWFEIIADYIKTKNLTNDVIYEVNSPYTDESLYYRQRFESIFGNKVATVIPHFWLPSWTEQKDPSARKLDVY